MTNRLSVDKGHGEPVVAEQLLQLSTNSTYLDRRIHNDDDVEEEEEVCENLGASGVMIALYLSRVIASRVNTEALTCELMPVLNS